MDYTENIRNFFIVCAVLVLGTISLVKIGTIDLHSIMATGALVVPAAIVLGILGSVYFHIAFRINFSMSTTNFARILVSLAFCIEFDIFKMSSLPIPEYNALFHLLKSFKISFSKFCNF